MEPEEVLAQELVVGFDEAPSQSGGWEAVCDALRAMVSHDAFQRWFRAARWMGVEDDTCTIAVPGEIHQVWIETNYMPELMMAVTGVFEDVREVRVVVSEEVPASGKDAEGSVGDIAHEARPSRAAALEGGALDKRVKSAGLNPAHTFASFVVGAN
ncbi:MAG: hypothetical protein EOP85_00835, partial [Verrucomicrobiaceae bacterium]